MAVLNILTAPDLRLKQKSTSVTDFTDEIRTLMKDMLDTMYYDHGVGLAAIQIGVPKEIIVIDLKEDDDHDRQNGFYPLFIVNPQIIWSSEEFNVASEGCLSVPNLRIDVPRPAEIKIKYLDFDGNPKDLHATSWLARVIQHEMDHLKGTLIIDYLSTLKKDLAISKLKKFKKQLL